MKKNRAEHIPLKSNPHFTPISNFFIEEGLGLIALNDRTISGTDEWDYGANFSLAAGFDLRDLDKKGFKLSLGTEYGLTFNNTLASYFSLYLQAQYFIF